MNTHFRTISLVPGNPYFFKGWTNKKEITFYKTMNPPPPLKNSYNETILINGYPLQNYYENKVLNLSDDHQFHQYQQN